MYSQMANVKRTNTHMVMSMEDKNNSSKNAAWERLK